MAPATYKLPVFVGRFQPLHRGHLEVMKELSGISGKDRFMIIIGSMQESSTKDNPFTFSERREMIEKALKAEGIKNFKIFGVRDFNDDLLWTKNVMELLGSGYIEAYTRNNWTRSCFRKIGVAVKWNQTYYGISSTKIRSRIRKGLEWKSLVPLEVSRYLQKIGGDERIRITGNLELKKRPLKKI